MATWAVVRSWPPAVVAMRCVWWRVRVGVLKGGMGGVVGRPEAGILGISSTQF